MFRVQKAGKEKKSKLKVKKQQRQVCGLGPPSRLAQGFAPDAMSHFATTTATTHQDGPPPSADGFYPSPAPHSLTRPRPRPRQRARRHPHSHPHSHPPNFLSYPVTEIPATPIIIGASSPATTNCPATSSPLASIFTNSSSGTIFTTTATTPTAASTPTPNPSPPPPSASPHLLPQPPPPSHPAAAAAAAAATTPTTTTSTASTTTTTEATSLLFPLEDDVQQASPPSSAHLPPQLQPPHQHLHHHQQLQQQPEVSSPPPQPAPPPASVASSTSPSSATSQLVVAQLQKTLREAVRNEDPPGLRRLLEAKEGKINLNVMDAEGQTALHQSCQLGNLEMVKLLVRFGADVRLANRDGWSAVHIAAFGGHTDILLYLMKANNNLSSCGRS